MDLFKNDGKATIGPWGIGIGLSGSPALIGGDGTIIAIFKSVQQTKSGPHDLRVASKALDMVSMLEEMHVCLTCSASLFNEGAQDILSRASILIDEVRNGI